MLVRSYSTIIAVLFCLIASVASGQQITPKYDGKEDHKVSLDAAMKYVQNYRAKSDSTSLRGGYFGRSAFDQILSQKGCVGIRYYYATTDNGVATLVLVGVDSTGTDMSNGVICDQGIPCPPWCTSSGPLVK